MTTTETLKLALEALKQIDEAMPFPVAKLAQSALREALASEAIEQPAQQGCLRCNTPKKCALYGCSPLTWPVEQPAHQEPVAWKNAALRVGEDLCSVGPFGYYDMTAEQWLDWALSVVTVHAPPAQRKPLTDEEILSIARDHYNPHQRPEISFARAIEAAHGIKEKNT